MLPRMAVPTGRRMAPRHRATHRLHVRVPVELVERLAAAAERSGVTYSVLIERLLDTALADHEPDQEELPLADAS
jgi:predicted HicB family RNase H-like nuclease